MNGEGITIPIMLTEQGWTALVNLVADVPVSYRVSIVSVAPFLAQVTQFTNRTQQEQVLQEQSGDGGNPPPERARTRKAAEQP